MIGGNPSPPTSPSAPYLAPLSICINAFVPMAHHKLRWSIGPVGPINVVIAGGKDSILVPGGQRCPLPVIHHHHDPQATVDRRASSQQDTITCYLQTRIPAAFHRPGPSA